METEVYSWRVSADLKTSLEREVQRRKTSVATVLELAAREWLSKSGAEIDDAEEQLRLRNAASECFGTFASGNPQRPVNVGKAIRERLHI